MNDKCKILARSALIRPKEEELFSGLMEDSDMSRKEVEHLTRQRVGQLQAIKRGGG